LYRYVGGACVHSVGDVLGYHRDAARELADAAKAAMGADAAGTSPTVGAVQAEIQSTHSLKAPDSNP
jgi:hypothetical protein